MIFGNPEFTNYFITNPITWIILILGFPPVMSLWMRKIQNNREVKHD